MTLEQLRIFIAVADKEHVTKASRQLNLTQSAVSAAVAALEAHYNIKLFDRVGRGIVLTQTGRTFLPEARAVLARAKAAEQSLQDLGGLQRGSLSISASQTIGNYWLPARLQRFQAAHPGIELHVRIGNTEAVARDVNEGRADLGLVEGEIDDAVLSARKIAGDALIVVVGMTHPWAKKRRVAPSMLVDTGWVLREPGSGTRSMFEAGLKHYGLKLTDLSIKLELPSNEALRSAVEAGQNATAISDLVVAPSLAAHTLHRVQVDLPRRSFYVLHHKERHPSPAEQALLRTFDAP
jgi:DNA-binding transcriptional LysR family regulator